jgi:membrane-associated phospholipid phosphatase
VSRVSLVILALLAAAFAVLACFAHVSPYFPSDPAVSRFIQSYDGLLSVMRALSTMSSFIPATIIVAAVVALLVVRKKRLESIISGAATGIAALISLPIKDAIGRPRPAPELVQVFDFRQDAGFPSGHTIYAVVFYGLLIYFIPRLIGAGKVARVVQVLLGALIVATAISRVYLGAHWASDVLGGLLLGGVVLVGAVGLYCHYRDRFRREHA